LPLTAPALQEHGFLANGDNSYVVVLFRGGFLWYFQATSVNDEAS
jgi:hypothetical protein